MISVIIPTYREPEYLLLCLKSCIEGQSKENQIIVVVDGYFEENKSVLEKYSSKIEILNLPQNVGLCKATNLGVYNSSNEWVLIVNDDNVFPKNWDEKLSYWTRLRHKVVVSPNQIEPTPSIFNDFIIQDCGRDPNDFDLESFWKLAEEKSKRPYLNKKGGTLPIFIKREDFLRVGGWDEDYPPTGVVADWDFFHKCELSNMDLVRDYSTYFYHFVSKATVPTQEQNLKRMQHEYEGHEYAKYKWGYVLKHNLLKNG